MTPLRQTVWRLPIALILLGILPIAASIYRVIVLATTDAATIVNPDEVRFFDMPGSILAHVIFGTLFLILGAFQMSPGLRRRSLQLHRRIGRAAAVSALVFALTGVWMVFAYPPHSQSSSMVDVGRVAFGLATSVFIVLGILAVIRKNLAAHRAWMIRGYALAAASGIQSYLIAIVTVAMGAFDPKIADAMIVLGWFIGILAAERIIGPKQSLFGART